MGIKIKKADYDALPESLKNKFTASGDEYELQEEDVEGLKKSKAEILAEKKRIQDERDELAKFKSEHEATEASAEEEKLKAAGQFKEVEERYKQRITELETAHAAEKNSLLGTVKAEKLKSFLVEKGVLPDRAGYALADTLDQFDIESGEQGFTLKLKNGIGDAKELDGAIEGLKAKAGFLFAPNGAAGSGASQSTAQQGGVDLNSMTAEQMLDMANAATTK
jgi:hypothetical protein